MNTPFSSLRALALMTAVAILSFSPWAAADPPSRVARLGYTSGAVSFSPAGESDWVEARLNRPLTIGDRLWADADSRAEIQVGAAMIRMHAGTSVAILNLDDRIAQIQLTQGTLNVRVRALDPDQLVEVATPNLAFTIRRAGAYRIEVDPDGTATTIVVRDGRGEVYGEGASYVVDTRQPYRFTGTDLREYQYVDAPRLDAFDRWADDRDRLYDNSVSARYVSRDVVGYQDLDANGTWRADARYGNVWFPSRVDADWSPYQNGHWAWVDPWGWTWVDDAPWGFAVSHYGRWTSIRGTWGWVPGPVRSRAYYAPALVAFVGGANFQLSIASGNVGGVAWFPLGPREVYRPSYAVSRGYFENVNRSNTVINTTVINNYYNNTNVTNVVYANRSVPGAVVAVPTTVFAQSQPVSRGAVRVRQEAIATAPVVVVPSIAPTARSVRGTASAGGTPPARTFARPVVARTAPAPAPAGFAAQQRQLEAKPGMPLDETTRRQLQPAAAAASAPLVRVVEQPRKAPPTMRPPPAEASAGSGNARGRAEQRDASEQRERTVAPSPSERGVAQPAPAASRPSIDRPPQQRGQAEQRASPESRGQPAAAAPAPPQAAQIPPAASRPSIDRPPQQRGQAEQRASPESRGQPVAAPPAPPQAAIPPAASRPSIDKPPQQRGQAEQRAAPESRGQPVAAPPAAPQAAIPPAASRPSIDKPPQQRGQAEQRGQSTTPPPQRPVEPREVVTKGAPPAPAAAAPSQRPVQQQAAPVPERASPAPATQQRAQRTKPESGPAARPPETRSPAAAPKQATPQSRPAPNAEPRDQRSPPDKGRSDEKGKDGDEEKREGDGRKPKG